MKLPQMPITRQTRDLRSSGRLVAELRCWSGRIVRGEGPAALLPPDERRAMQRYRQRADQARFLTPGPWLDSF